MRKQMFKKSHYLMITILYLFLTGWSVVTAYSAVLPENRQESDVTHAGEKAVPLMVLAQNQSGGASNESLGEIFFLNTKEDEHNSIVSIESTRPVQYTAFKLLNPLRLVLDFPKMDQGNLTSRIQVDKGVVNSIRPIHFKEAGVLRLEIVLNQSADYEIKKPGKNKLVVHLKSSEKEVPQSQPMKETDFSNETVRKKGTPSDTDGEKLGTYDAAKDTCYPLLYGKKETVSLDFQNADVRNLFRVFAEISGFNVILSPEVGGSVNIRMMDVAWNEAMEIILTNSSLGRECFGSNIVRIVTKAVLAAEENDRVAEKARAAAERTNEEAAQVLVTEVVRIDNADITELSTSLTALKSAREDAKITVDTRTNMLILNDLRKHVDEMLETIKVLDVPTAQVLIEAKIVEVNKSFTQELGVQWGITGEVLNNATLGASDTSSVTSTTQTTSAGGVATNTSTTDSKFLVDLAQAGAISAGNLFGFDLALGALIPGSALNIRLEALETQGKGRVLSSPRVTTADNKEAKIKSGSQIPYQVTSAEGNSIQFVDAELSLTVTPHVTTDNKVYMVIDATKNAADFSRLVGSVPTITTKETHTEVLVGNGDTTVLGGVYESAKTESKKEVPFFSKIPLLGILFRSFTDSDAINELLVFVTPTIVETF